MATAEDLRAQIAASRALVAEAKADGRRLVQEAKEAEARQLLRRELEQVQGELRSCRVSNCGWLDRRHAIDGDCSGPHLRSDGLQGFGPKVEVEDSTATNKAGTLDCSAAVVNGDIEWSMKGFSWLKETLLQQGDRMAQSPSIDVCGHTFTLVYNPAAEFVDGFGQTASLAVQHSEHSEYQGVTFRYSMSIKSRDRGYVQWGDWGSICDTGDADDKIFGPDVCNASSSTPLGIFGMSHAQLEKSEWVTNDELLVKLKVQVRENIVEETQTHADDGIMIPPSCLSDQNLLFLESGVGSDIKFIVQGETIQAHSQILSARSEVLQCQFSCGMQESMSKEVTIEDCSAQIFKAFLQYLYSDSFASLQDFIKQNSQEQCSNSQSSLMTSSTDANSGTGKMPMLQHLLALSHKYQQSRLQLWCERELCKSISIDQVCSVLCQAHLYEALKLEERCLSFIADHMADVMKTDSFGTLCSEWPQVSLKITLHLSAVPKSAAAAVVEKQENAHKRKRVSD